MQFNKRLAALGTVALTVAVVSGCSSTSSHYGVVQASPLDATPIPDWMSKAVKVRCESDEYAVYKDKEKKHQKCYEPSKSAVMIPVNDWSFINKYPCGPGKKLSFVPETGRKLVFCFEGKKKHKAKATPTPTPVSTSKATPTWKPSTSNTVNPTKVPSAPKTLTPPKDRTSDGTVSDGKTSGSRSSSSSRSSGRR